jgi:hypothetical protein
MSGQLLPPPELTPTLPPDLTPEQRILLWVDLMDTCEQFLLAGLRRTVASDEELQAAYRKWYEERMEEHDRTVCHMLEEFHRRVDAHGR